MELSGDPIGTGSATRHSLDPGSLPDPLRMEDGSVVTDETAWTTRRRPELLDLFARHVYGRTPVGQFRATTEVIERDRHAMAGRAQRTQLHCIIERRGYSLHLDVLVYAPADRAGVPVFSGLNFLGNQSVTADPDVALSSSAVHQVVHGLEVGGTRRFLRAIAVDESSLAPGTARHLAANSPVSGGETVLRADREVGSVQTDGPRLADGRRTGVALVAPEAAEPGTAVTVRSLEKLLPGEVVRFDVDGTRGLVEDRWPIETIIERGFAVATAHCADLDPDIANFGDGAHPLFYESGRDRPSADEWGSIGAWAWGLSRLLDALPAEPVLDVTRVAVMGHSRLGKAALWAAARDERFAMAISNMSGCLGASLSRHRSGETISALTSRYPHWCARNLTPDTDPEDLPVDQHQLLALVAPRPVYVASASDDLWADPVGEHLAARCAAPVYELLGAPRFERDEDEMPVLGHDGPIGYHLRPGQHEMTPADWAHYLDFADRWLR